MKAPLRLLLIEDSKTDARLLLRHLGRGGYEVVSERVETPEDMTAALDGADWDVIISDYFIMPGFDAPDALALLQERGLDLPFIIVSGMVGEDRAVAAMKAGAHDYVMKSNLTRLGPVIERELREAENRRERRRAEEKYRSIFENAVEGIFQSTLDGRFLTANPMMARIFGYSTPEELMASISGAGRPHYVDPDRRAEFARLMRQHGAASDFEVQAYRKDGSVIWVSINARALYGAGGRITGYEGTMEDITGRKALEEQLKHQAFHDALTGLPNRALFSDRLKHSLARGRRWTDRMGRVAVLFIDLDNFKVVNDSLGHEAGDRLLVEAAGRLSSCIRPGDTVARLGGDEFAILLEKLESPDDAARVAGRISRELSEPFELSGRSVFVGASVGIALGGGPGEDNSEDLIRRSDLAMYGAKKKGKGRYEVFDPSMNAAAHARLGLESDLRRALERGEFRLHYQPKVTLGSGRIMGVEALIRWEHPELGLISPAQFIPVAEETGLILPIGRWVLLEACRWTRERQDRQEKDLPDAPPLMVSVNLSARQFQQEDLSQDVAHVLEETGLPASSLNLEITESVVMDDAPSTASILQELKALGVRLSIDDFGTGYSSLAYLKRFPVDFLKVDRSFVGNIGENGGAEDFVLVSGIVSLARNLGFTVVAEGVETLDQLERLQELGCDLAQGYYFSRPLPGTGIDDLILGREPAITGGG